MLEKELDGLTGAADTARHDATQRWRRALEDLWNMNRCHAGQEASIAYRKLTQHYPGTEIFGFDSGSKSGAWVAPTGWDVNHARLRGPDGRIIADYDTCRLHLYTYSPSFKGTVSREELEPHLMSNPRRPDIVPFHFRNQYRHWAPEWGFCLADNVRRSLPAGQYEVDIETTFAPSQMEMAEQTHHGELDDCLLLIGHFDHPAQCNDGLVGCLAGHEIISRLAGRQTRLTYRMLSTVEIVGSVFYAEQRAHSQHVRQGLFVGMSGGEGPFLFQTSSGGDSSVDRAVQHILKHAAPDATIAEFREFIGNDETAFDCHGIDIPCSSLLRDRPIQYHSSDDTPENVLDNAVEEMISVTLRAIGILEANARLEGTFRGLPCLASPEYDLYLNRLYMSGFDSPPNKASRRLLELLKTPEDRKEAVDSSDRMNRLMTLLPTMVGGKHSTLDVADRVGMPFAVVDAYTELWADKGLLRKTWINPFGA